MKLTKGNITRVLNRAGFHKCDWERDGAFADGFDTIDEGDAFVVREVLGAWYAYGREGPLLARIHAEMAEVLRTHWTVTLTEDGLLVAKAR